MSKQMKLTPSVLKRIIAEEKKKLEKKGLLGTDAKEANFGSGDVLVNAINYIEKLGIKEQKLKNELRKIREQKTALKRKILKNTG